MIIVSIIIPSFNSSKFISQTLQSVLCQSFSDWEIIIVDDYSSDNSVEVIQFFVALDSRIKLIQSPENFGVASARNLAIKAAKGRYIAFLDSDDIWLPNKLEKQLAFMQTNNYPFTFTAYDKINEFGHVVARIGVPNRVSYFNLLKTCSIGCLTAMYDTEYFGKVYMTNSTKREDFATWLYLLKKLDYAYALNLNLSQYRVHSSQSSSNKIKMAVETWRLYREVEGMSLIKTGYYFSHYALSGFLRTKAPRLAKIIGFLK